MLSSVEMCRKIGQKIAEKGGKCYYVGGCVRDEILGRSTKDIDIEVHLVTPDALREALSELGEVNEFGVSFGIFNLKGYDIDIAMPRLETCTGRGHRDFDVYVDPFLGEKKAALRRDFTVNALMKNVLTGEILDFFGGVEDRQDGVIRHVNDSSFAEDPLRVLRACQFAARFNFKIHEQTVELCKNIDITTLAGERIYGELIKALKSAEKPSVFFEELRKMNKLSPWCRPAGRSPRRQFPPSSTGPAPETPPPERREAQQADRCTAAAATSSRRRRMESYYDGFG